MKTSTWSRLYLQSPPPRPVRQIQNAMAPNDPSAGGAFPRDRLVKMYLTYVTNTSITVMARFLWCYYDRAELKQKSRRERNIYFVGHACLYFAYACFIGITITQLHSLVLSETGSPLTHIHEKRHSYPDYEHGQEHDEAAHTVILKVKEILLIIEW